MKKLLLILLCLPLLFTTCKKEEEFTYIEDTTTNTPLVLMICLAQIVTNELHPNIWSTSCILTKEMKILVSRSKYIEKLKACFISF